MTVCTGQLAAHTIFRETPRGSSTEHMVADSRSDSNATIQ